MRHLLLTLTLFVTALAASATAQISDAEEDRARDIGHQLRCVVCQNQSIEESEADLALDMKVIVRERVAAGDTNAEVVAYMRDRYGDYVLLKPPVQSNTYVLWFLPAGLVLFGLGWFALRSKRQSKADIVTEISDTDQALLDKLMADDT
ncbi:cytochrome c-type biogenesis protein [Litorimonas sp. WD9-15]|uniref:cytochrome c-type biogenesis protein n=1 Tax=Litorimonas sp. WD9-15 TaxID=3418716 RepID=UPI003D05B8C3